MGDAELTDTINKAVAAAVERELGAYKVPKEQHYKDHLFLTELREWTDNIKSSIWKSLVMMVVPGLVFLLIFGFITWSGIKNIGGFGH